MVALPHVPEHDLMAAGAKPQLAGSLQVAAVHAPLTQLSPLGQRLPQSPQLAFE
jgi:hypothetical protein